MRSGMSSSVDQSRSLSISRSEEEQSNGSGAADPSKRLSDSDSSTCFTQSLKHLQLGRSQPSGVVAVANHASDDDEILVIMDGDDLRDWKQRMRDERIHGLVNVRTSCECCMSTASQIIGHQPTR